MSRDSWNAAVLSLATNATSPATIAGPRPPRKDATRHYCSPAAHAMACLGRAENHESTSLRSDGGTGLEGQQGLQRSRRRLSLAVTTTPPFQHPRQFRLLELNPGRHGSPLEGTVSQLSLDRLAGVEYVALSYEWGADIKPSKVQTPEGLITYIISK